MIKKKIISLLNSTQMQIQHSDSLICMGYNKTYEIQISSVQRKSCPIAQASGFCYWVKTGQAPFSKITQIYIIIFSEQTLPPHCHHSHVM